MIQKQITFFGHQCILACDAKCEKAWGINRRPRFWFSFDEDDYALLADHELGTAPVDPGTYEGVDAKPDAPEKRLNRWCARECERSSLVRIGEPVIVRDFSKRYPNQPDKHVGDEA